MLVVGPGNAGGGRGSAPGGGRGSAAGGGCGASSTALHEEERSWRMISSSFFSSDPLLPSSPFPCTCM